MPELTLRHGRPQPDFVHNFSGQPCGQAEGMKDKPLIYRNILILT